MKRDGTLSRVVSYTSLREDVGVVGRLGLPTFEIGLAHVRGFGGIESGFQVGFFQEVAPALVVIGGALLGLKFLDRGFGVLQAFDDFDHSCGFVGADVVADDDVSGAGFFVGQSGSLSARRSEACDRSGNATGEPCCDERLLR